jgi:hypothetical protein
VYGGFVDRVHDLLLCGVDPHVADLTARLSSLRGDKDDDTILIYREMDALLIASSRAWRPSCHAFLYGPQFQACIALLCTVKVGVTFEWDMLFYPSLSLTLHFVF